jgi:hypothetical protein
MVSTLTENPKYNGTHACPVCGTKSHWTCVNDSPVVVRIECDGECGTFETAYADVQSKPFFEKNIRRATR